MQSSFFITSNTDFKTSIDKISVGTVLEIRKSHSLSRHIHDETVCICILPSQYSFYNAACWEINTYSSWISYEEKIKKPLSDLIDTDYEVIKPFASLVEEIVFLRLSLVEEGEKYNKVEVKEIIDPKNLWEYWLVKNTYTNPTHMQHIGLGEAVYNKVPIGKNYFGMCYICSCGVAACYNYKAWYIRNKDSYTIGFVVALNQTLMLDSKDPQFDEEDYQEFKQQLKQQEEHNSKLEQIEESLAVSEAYFPYDRLSEEDKAIIKAGVNTFNYPYTMELEPNDLYPPILSDNDEMKYLKLNNTVNGLR